MTSKHETKGQRRLVITPELLEEFFIHGVALRSSIPDDARLVGHWRNEMGNHEFLFESSEWDALQEGERIPEGAVTMEGKGSTVVRDCRNSSM